MKSRKMVLMNLSTGQNRDTDVEDGFGDAAGTERVERTESGERSSEMHISPCVKQVAGGELLCATGKPSLALCDDPERRGGRRGGRLQREELYVVCTGMTAETNTTL